MQQESAQPGLFWLAAMLAGMALLIVLAKPLLGVRDKTRRAHWIALLACLMPASGVTAPKAPVTLSMPAGHYGWSSIHAPLDHKPYTGRDLLQQT